MSVLGARPPREGRDALSPAPVGDAVDAKCMFTYGHLVLNIAEVILPSVEYLCRLSSSCSDRPSIFVIAQKGIEKCQTVLPIVEIIMSCQTVLLNE